jgi:hypothetical protein
VIATIRGEQNRLQLALPPDLASLHDKKKILLLGWVQTGQTATDGRSFRQTVHRSGVAWACAPFIAFFFSRE